MKESQNDEILEALKRGEALTPLDALNRFGCFRLGARVYDLKVDGYDIITEMVTENGKRFARYRMLRKEPVQMALV